jgi:CheY-like chemotaxis protein
MFQSLAKSKLIDFKVNYPEKNYELIGDSARLLQILVNLTSNSLKFTRQGFVNISCNLTTNYQFAKVCFCIEDTGIGIPPESIPDLFRPWSQASNAKTEYIGSGLGLCICRSLIDLMQGNINIESEVGRGTKIWFTVDLPLAYPEQIEEIEQAAAKEVFNSILPEVESPAQKLSKVNPLYRSNNLADKFQCQKVQEFDTNLKRKRPITSNSITNGGGQTTGKNGQLADSPMSDPSHTHFILIAEDNPVNQIIIKKYISKLSTVGFVLVSDGKLAWEEYQKHPAGYFDVILLDHLMPEMGGDEVCKLIKEKDPSQKIISVSANALPTDIEYFKQIGMDDFLEKPFTFPKFKTLLQKWLKELD